jgi:hypothetical protein
VDLIRAQVSVLIVDLCSSRVFISFDLVVGVRSVSVVCVARLHLDHVQRASASISFDGSGFYCVAF